MAPRIKTLLLLLEQKQHQLMFIAPNTSNYLAFQSFDFERT
jgi:hypothetical protein